MVVLDDMTVGSLLQYKERFYGRFHSKLPKIPFDHHQFLASINQNVLNIPLSMLQSGYRPSPRETARKKYVLFCTQIVRVEHPTISTVGCNYLKCFISDPYVAGDTTDGWIRDEWVEPLNELETYYDENARMIQEKLKSMAQKEPTKLNSQSFQEFQNWIQDVKRGRKTWGDS